MQSPNLNPIEMVWDELDRRVNEKQPTSAQHMWELHAPLPTGVITTSEGLELEVVITIMLDYGDVIYRSAGKGALERQDVLYHSSRRFTTNSPYRTHHCTLYSSVNLLQDPLVYVHL